MKICVVSAGLGGFDAKRKHEKQSVDCDFYHFDDSNFPPREKALTPRTQARIVKMFGWQLIPDYNYYLWVDSSCRLSHKDSVKFFIDKCKDVVVMKHPHRSTIQAEAHYIQSRLNIKCPYITPRYKNELIKEQIKEINTNKDFVDNKLFASTVFGYKNTEEVQEMLKEWWYHTSRYHIVDQLSFPYVLETSGVPYEIIPDNYLKSEYIQYVR